VPAGRRLAVLAALPLLAGCGSHGRPSGPDAHGPAGVVRIALAELRWPLDPARVDGEDERTLARALLAAPLRVDAAGRLEPGLCAVPGSPEDGRTWRLRCRHAPAIARELRRVAWLAPALERAEAPAPTALRVRLHFPWRRFPLALTAPETAPSGVPGPFRVAARSPRRLVAARPGLRLVFSRLAPEEALRAFRRGRVDVARVPAGDLGLIRADLRLRPALRVRPLLALDLVSFRSGGVLDRLPATRLAYWRSAGRGDYASLVGERAAVPALGLVPGSRHPGVPRLLREQRALIAPLPKVEVRVAAPPELREGAELLVALWLDLGLGPRLAASRPDARLERLVAPYPHREAPLVALLFRRRLPGHRALLRALASPRPGPLLRQADSTLERSARVVPIAWAASARLVSPRLRGWRSDALGDVDYTRVRSRASSRSRSR
jgi:hypothetical protein